MTIDDQIKNLTKQLYPTGRVWRIIPNSVKEKFINGLLASEIRAYNDAVSIRDSAIPDNANFSVDDASAWEVRLGLPDGTGIDLADRMKAIVVQLNWPGTNPAKGAVDYIQGVLNAAGYNVCVHENLTQQTYAQFAGINLVRHKPTLLHGQQRHGFLTSKGIIVANSIDPKVDDSFNVGDYSDTVFIGGCPAGTFVNIPLAQQTAFRQLILKIKPVNITALLLVNFV